MIELFKIAAVFLACWVLFGIAVIANTDESIWAGVPRWRAVLTWPLAFFH
jgi:hypothetical protein